MALNSGISFSRRAMAGNSYVIRKSGSLSTALLHLIAPTGKIMLLR
jgi:hypothetical protein